MEQLACNVLWLCSRAVRKAEACDSEVSVWRTNIVASLSYVALVEANVPPDSVSTAYPAVPVLV